MMAPDWLRRSVTAVEESSAVDGAVGAVDPVARRLTSGSRGDALRGEWLGHALHPLLTDFPLGCWAAASLLDIVGGRSARMAAQRLVGLGLMFVPLTAASGMADFAVVDDQRVRRVGAVHAIGNAIVAGVYLTSWRKRRHGLHLSGVVLSMVGGTVAWGTGYLGGHMSFARGAGV
ncbi:MAG: Ferredoxin, 2Fe-2S, partial [Ilumatobacteraceae bacterium]|nr:Ferredoxin, 2Fe-2S [Ilumatobacteraceae bacterium]